MSSAVLQIFKEALSRAEQAYEGNLVDEEPKDIEIKFDAEPVENEDVVNAAFIYSILNGDKDSPHLNVDLKDFSTDSLDSLAKLLAPMAHPQFFYLALMKIEQDFVAAGREMDFNYLVKQIELGKAEFESEMGKPYITPLDLSKRANNE